MDNTKQRWSLRNRSQLHLAFLLDVHVHFVSSAHYGAGCYFDIRKGESLVVVVRCSLLLLLCVLFVWCVLYVALC